jgi:hypothetical protein
MDLSELLATRRLSVWHQCPVFSALTREQIRIKGLSDETGTNIFGKAEFQNPGGSVKDRAVRDES